MAKATNPMPPMMVTAGDRGEKTHGKISEGNKIKRTSKIASLDLLSLILLLTFKCTLLQLKLTCNEKVLLITQPADTRGDEQLQLQFKLSTRTQTKRKIHKEGNEGGQERRKSESQERENSARLTFCLLLFVQREQDRCNG